jgi:hypothetical protein
LKQICFFVVLFYVQVTYSESVFSKFFGEDKAQEFKDPSFLENQPLGKPFVELNKKYRNSFQPDTCPKWLKKDLNKNAAKAKCYNLFLSFGRTSDQLMAAVQNDSVVAYMRGIAGDINSTLMKSPMPEEEFGAEGPSSIYEQKRVDAPGIRDFVLTWQLSNGYINASVACITKRYAGKVTVGPLRKCSMHRFQMYTIRSHTERLKELANDPRLKVSDEKY